MKHIELEDLAIWITDILFDTSNYQILFNYTTILKHIKRRLRIPNVPMCDLVIPYKSNDRVYHLIYQIITVDLNKEQDIALDVICCLVNGRTLEYANRKLNNKNKPPMNAKH